ncbi:hypothetical protein P168DRAFT_321410 [Aspergillus campestris IBT 28561]|uniref:NAD(P)-binding protein n=1 Tax=Aspergillus campestris (strain IBT 28561) TaxID=1392248 RepID=A0A2I1CTL4_ASPC2|nr:uncharacterized protein P168DRAFT_321410 [Aspergillus campestris IBT 28561]PKY00976.1 hypothetical protein P168DRAFT_321410 [Aspergillus campestris IBT 28561]
MSIICPLHMEQCLMCPAASDRPYTIHVGSRSRVKAQSATALAQEEPPTSASTLVPLVVDIESDESIKHAAAELQAQHGKVDVVINNANVQFNQRESAGKIRERKMWNRSWNVNTAGTHILTATVAPLGRRTRASGRTRVPPKGWPRTALSVRTYRSAKTGLNMLMREGHGWLHAKGAKGSSSWARAPAVAGPFIRSAVVVARNDDVGRVINQQGVQPW